MLGHDNIFAGFSIAQVGGNSLSMSSACIAGGAWSI
jgi:hypothetical protein